MKRIILLAIFSLMVGICNGQEWFSSFDVAKRLARVQDKMLFVVWEASFDDSIVVLINSDEGDVAAVDLSKDIRLDATIWEYFIPVKLSELEYANFIKAANGRGYSYLNKLNDNSIKIMDVNGNILNIADNSDSYTNFSLLVNKYALNTSFLRSEFESYSEEKNFLSSFLLALRYIDFTIFADVDLRPELIALANIYLDESEKFASLINDDQNASYLQKIELVRIKELLILNQHRRAYRQIKKIDESQVEAINKSLFVFLNYTVSMLLNDEINADLWKSKISSLDLKWAELILKNNANGNTN